MNCAFCGRKYFYDHEVRCEEFKIYKRNLLKFVIDISESLNIPTNLTSTIDRMEQYFWDGKVMPISINGDGLHVTLHEISHWIFASKEERLRRDFGMAGSEEDDKNERVVNVIEKTLNSMIKDWRK